MMVLRRIVVVSKNTEIQQLAGRIGQQVLVADDAVEAVDIATTVAPDLILLDDLAQPSDIRRVLDASHNNFRTAVVVAGNNGPQPGWFAQFAQTDNIEYLPNPSDYEQLRQILNKIQSRSQAGSPGDANRFFADDLAAAVSMAGKSRAILHTLKMIKLVAGSNCNPVLIIGETGTGKELAAKAVHISRHPNEPFVAVNCAALTANLLESELFGHIKGSFTSADRDKTGLLDVAGQGTIFLDEISEMPPDLQAKLLRVLQEKTFRKVGGITDLVCKATIIASSNRDLRQEVQANRFRRDLYYRLNICPINIAPLRTTDRRTDIRILAEYFLRTSTVCPGKADKIASITEMALEAIERHYWPGNIRELRNIIDRAILLETTDKIGLSSILIEPDDMSNSCGCANRIGFVESDAARPRPKGGHDTFDPSRLGVEPRQDETSSATDRRNKQTEVTAGDFSLDKAERELIARALQESGWQKTRAAALLGITRATLYAKVKQHNIQRGTYLPKAAQDDQLSPLEQETVTAA
jgi:two-component system, NtrC family, response regulator AtoC